MTEPAQVFDRRLLRLRRDRAAPLDAKQDILFSEAADRLADRLSDFRRPFPLVLELGCHFGRLGQRLGNNPAIGQVIQADLSPAMVRRARHTGVVSDEEALPFKPATFDAVFSCLGLHWVNDLPGALLQIRQSLKPDGLFLGVMPGGDTLHELREALIWAETEVEGGVSPRVSPFAQLEDAAALLQRAGFALPVADADRLTITYDSPLRLIADLRASGEANVLHARRGSPLRRETLAAAVAYYQEQFALPDHRVPATFQLLYLTGWAPHTSQQQALRPGSARLRLADALETMEKSAGDHVAPKD